MRNGIGLVGPSDGDENGSENLLPRQSLAALANTGGMAK